MNPQMAELLKLASLGTCVVIVAFLVLGALAACMLSAQISNERGEP